MADKRLQDIRTADDAESTVNVELIEWLKTSGVNYLLFILVIVILFRGYLWWGEHQDRLRDAAWADLEGTDSAASLEALADRAKGIDSVPELALLRAARLYEMDILRDQTLDLVPETPAVSDPNNPDDAKATEDAKKPVPRMTEAERSQTLNRMEDIYTRVFEMTQKSSSGTNWKELQHIEAMFGLASVAEMRGDFDKAKDWFTRIESEAAPRYQQLSEVATAWKSDQETARTRIEFPEAADVEKYLRDPLPDSPFGVKKSDSPTDKPADTGDATSDTKTEGDADKPADKPAEDQPAGDKPAEEKPDPGDGG